MLGLSRFIVESNCRVNFFNEIITILIIDRSSSLLVRLYLLLHVRLIPTFHKYSTDSSEEN